MVNGHRVSTWDDEPVLEMDSGDGCTTLSASMLNVLKCTFQMVKIVKCIYIFYNHLKPTSCSYTRPVLHFYHLVPFIPPKWSYVPGFRLPLLLGSGVLFSAPHTPHREHLAHFSSLDSCASFKTKFLGLLWKPLRIWMSVPGCFPLWNSVAIKAVKLGRDVHPEHYSVGQDI